MTEIEIKAHVRNKKQTIEKICSFAKYTQTVTRNDIYYHLDLNGQMLNGKPYASCRIRSEEKETPDGTKSTVIFTYKAKSLIQSESGIPTEVNDEKECVVSDRLALEKFFLDCGFTEALRKKKIVEDYEAETPYGTATLELCNVQELGDFLEIEILYNGSDQQTIRSINSELVKILEKCGIPQTEIEPKYYSQMLDELKKAKM